MRKPNKGLRRTMLAAAVPVGMVVSGALVWQSSYAAFSDTTVNPGNSFTAGSVVLDDNDSNTALFSVSDLAPKSTWTFKCIRLDYTGTLNSSAVKMYVAAANYTHANGDGGASDHSRDLGSSLDFSVDAGPEIEDDTPVGVTDVGANTACTGWVDGSDTEVYGDESETGSNKLYDHTTAANGFASAYTTYANGVSTVWSPQGTTAVAGTKYKWIRIGYRLANPGDHGGGLPTQATVDAAQGDNVTFSVTWEARNA